MVYMITRPRMTRAELAGHEANSYGRDYSESDDGYGDMEAEEKRGWRAQASWGRDGWNLGEWPYVMIYTRERPGLFGLMQIVEGDRTVWAFSSAADRDAAVDYLFLWYAAGKSWAPLSWEDREKLDAGELPVPDSKWRGPVRFREGEQ